jgi:hypothetical protein
MFKGLKGLEKLMKNKFMYSLMYCLLLLQGLSLSLNAQDGIAGMPGTYLHMGVGSGALGMGKAYTAFATDATAIYWNPAALANQNPYQVYFMHSVLFFDTNFDYLAGTLPTKNLGSFGLGILYLNSGDFDQRNELNQELGSFNISDMALLLSWSKEIYRGISAGLNYKLVNQRILDYSGTGHGFDLGLKTKLFNRVDTGLMFMNLVSPKMKLAYESETFPMQVRFGASMRLLEDKLVLSADVAKIISWEYAFFNIGTEYSLIDNLAIRAGLNNGRITMGLGFTLDKIGVDYGNKNVSEFGFTQNFAVKYAFGGFGVGAKANPDIFSPMGEQNISHITLQAKSRSDILEWSFDILDKQGNVIRSFSERGGIPEEIVWDGRDNSGSLVQDGKFKYNFEIWTQNGESYKNGGVLVSIDTEGPSGSLGLRSEE